MTDDKSDVDPSKLKNYPLKISEPLFNRVDKHIQLLKHLDNRSQNKQRWIIEAIKENLAKDEEAGFPIMPKARNISLKFDETLSKQLERKVGLVKKTKGSYSLKTLILDAIEEKLQKEKRLSNSIGTVPIE